MVQVFFVFHSFEVSSESFTGNWNVTKGTALFEYTHKNGYRYTFPPGARVNIDEIVRRGHPHEASRQIGETAEGKEKKKTGPRSLPLLGNRIPFNHRRLLSWEPTSEPRVNLHGSRRDLANPFI